MRYQGARHCGRRYNQDINLGRSCDKERKLNKSKTSEEQQFGWQEAQGKTEEMLEKLSRAFSEAKYHLGYKAMGVSIYQTV